MIKTLKVSSTAAISEPCCNWFKISYLLFRLPEKLVIYHHFTPGCRFRNMSDGSGEKRNKTAKTWVFVFI